MLAVIDTHCHLADAKFRDDVEADLDGPDGNGKARVALSHDHQALRLWFTHYVSAGSGLKAPATMVMQPSLPLMRTTGAA